MAKASCSTGPSFDLSQTVSLHSLQRTKSVSSPVLSLIWYSGPSSGLLINHLFRDRPDPAVFSVTDDAGVVLVLFTKQIAFLGKANPFSRMTPAPTKPARFIFRPVAGLRVLLGFKLHRPHVFRISFPKSHSAIHHPIETAPTKDRISRIASIVNIMPCHSLGICDASIPSSRPDHKRRS